MFPSGGAGFGSPLSPHAFAISYQRQGVSDFSASDDEQDDVDDHPVHESIAAPTPTGGPAHVSAGSAHKVRTIKRLEQEIGK